MSVWSLPRDAWHHGGGLRRHTRGKNPPQPRSIKALNLINYPHSIGKLWGVDCAACNGRKTACLAARGRVGIQWRGQCCGCVGMSTERAVGMGRPALNLKWKKLGQMKCCFDSSLYNSATVVLFWLFTVQLSSWRALLIIRWKQQLKSSIDNSLKVAAEELCWYFTELSSWALLIIRYTTLRLKSSADNSLKAAAEQLCW
jgi:hypothetical protein